MVEPILSKDYFRINGVSSNSVGILVDTPSVPPMAQQRYTSYQIGNDEDGITSDNIYDNLKYSLTFYTFDRDTFDNTEIYAFLADASTLEISRLPDFYFKVRQVSEISPERTHDGKKVKYTVTFTLAPFKYRIDNAWISLNSGDIVTNTGTRYCKPTIEITGAGETDFLFNGECLKLFFPEEEQTVIVDTDRKIVYDKATNTLLWNYSAGKFPFLPTGDTQVVWYRTAEVTIRKNERCY